MTNTADHMHGGADRSGASLGRSGQSRIVRVLTTDHPIHEMSPLAIGGLVLLLLAVVGVVAAITLATRSSATPRYAPRTPAAKHYVAATGVLAHNLAVMGSVTPRTHRQWATSTALGTYALRADDAVVRYRLGVGPRPR